LFNDLKSQGFSPWLDRQNLFPGQIWENVIPRAIKESSFFLFLISSYSLGKRGYVQTELKMGLDVLNEFPPDEIYLIPVYVKKCEVSEEKLKRIHAVFLYKSYENGLQELLRTLNHYRKDKSTPSDRRSKIDDSPADQQSPSIADILAEIKSEEIRKNQMQKELEQEIERYEFLLNNHYGPKYNQYKDRAWQLLCSKFALFTQGVNPGDIWKLKFKAGLFKVGDIYKEPITEMEFVWVPSGCFMMGSDSKEAYENEKPVHEVCLDGFWIGKYEVTQGQWKKIMGNNPSWFKSGDNYPVETVSWNDAKDFISKLNQQSKKVFSLPTEAQWEYAARSGGKNQKYAGGDDIDKFAWYNSNSGNKTHAVGTKAPNDLGIYDMSGNVWEWCEDVYDEKAYEKHERNNPVITSGSSVRVFRGGSWLNFPRHVRAANRRRRTPDDRDNDLGFRLCLSQVR
jgi:formylglycine-generating enzyme required for sulfatase activity